MNNDYDVIEKFREFASNEQGIELPEHIVADGKLHRFRVDGEANGKLSGAYKLHLDGRPAGFVQNFKTDAKAKWKYTDPNYKKEPITPEKIKADAERKAEYERKADEARKADIESKAQAAIRARKEWNNTKTSDYNPYAERKGVQLHNARVSEYKGEQQLIIPIQDKEGNFVSLQRIKSDGTKMLFKDGQKQGAYSVLNKQPEPQIIAIAEGFATTASVIEDPYSVKNKIMGVMAVDAGNLKNVAEAMRELHPNAEILVFGDKGDDDHKGEKAAIVAARAVNGYSVMPPITTGDFNDYLTGKSGDITVSLENLINQSIGKVMANRQEIELVEKIESEEHGIESKFKYHFEVGENKEHSLNNAQQAENKAEELGLSSIDFVKPDGSILVFKKEDDVWINQETEFTISQLQADFNIATATDIKERAELRQQIVSIAPELDKRLAVLDARQADLISDEVFKESAYKSMAKNADTSKDYADALPVETKQAIEKESQQRASLESLDVMDKRLEAEANAAEKNASTLAYSGKFYEKHEAFEAGQDAYRGVNNEYQAKDLPMALEQPHRHDNLINKEQFMLGFMEQATPEDGFKSIEEAFKTRLPHLNADEYLSIALETVDRKSGEHDYSELPKLPLRESLKNPEISFEVINGADNDKWEAFNNASNAMERAVDVKAETIKIREQGQFTTEARYNEDAEFVMPDGESFSKKYVINSIQDAAVAEKVIEPKAGENIQTQLTPGVEVEQTKTVKITPEATQDNIPELDYSVMPAPANAEKVDISKPDLKAIEPEQKPESSKLIPKDVADKYLQVEDKFYFRKNKDVVIFEDKGAKLETKLNSPSVAADLVRIAAERNWKEIKITGTPEFKSEVWMEAESRGIATTGYKPTDIDKALLKERLAKNQTNTIEEVKVLEKTNEKPSVRQMLDEGSTDKKMLEQHLKSHPELKETFEYIDALKKQLEKSGATENQIKVYMDTTKDGMAQMIEAGKYPEFQKVEHRQDTRQDKQPESLKTQEQAQKEIVVTKTKTKSKDREMEL